MDHPKPAGATEGTVLGPFFTHDATSLDHGAEIFDETNDQPLLVCGTVRDGQGNPIEGVKVNVWQNDSEGNYDVQYEDRASPNGRGVLQSNTNGIFWFTATQPIAYPIPIDGPVGMLLKKLNRPANRPAHVHFVFDKDGYDRLIT
jgi:protocatechuate 3,4-dioxygenase beta subunit